MGECEGLNQIRICRCRGAKALIPTQAPLVPPRIKCVCACFQPAYVRRGEPAEAQLHCFQARLAGKSSGRFVIHSSTAASMSSQARRYVFLH